MRFTAHFQAGTLQCSSNVIGEFVVPLAQQGVLAYRAVAVAGFHTTVNTPVGRIRFGNYACPCTTGGADVLTASTMVGTITATNDPRVLDCPVGDGRGTFTANKK